MQFSFFDDNCVLEWSTLSRFKPQYKHIWSMGTNVLWMIRWLGLWLLWLYPSCRTLYTMQVCIHVALLQCDYYSASQSWALVRQWLCADCHCIKCTAILWTHLLYWMIQAECRSWDWKLSTGCAIDSELKSKGRQYKLQLGSLCGCTMETAMVDAVALTFS